MNRFFGRRVLIASFTGQFIATAVMFAAFGVFVIPLSEEFATPRGRLNLALSAGVVLMALLGPQIGHWLDRGLTRSLMLAGVALSGTGLIAMSQATALWQLGALFCVMVGVGAAFYGLTPSMALATNWFERRRGLALGITVAGATVATFVAPPAAAWTVEHFGWRSALLAFGCIALVLGLAVFARYAIARPDMVGQRPDGDPEPSDGDGSNAQEQEPTPTSVLVRDPRLWGLSIGFSLVFTSPIVMMPTIVPFAEDLGISPPKAVMFFSAAAPLSLLSKLIFGALADRVAPLIAGTPALAGDLFDSSGTYHTVFVVEAALLALGGVLLSIPRIPRAGTAM